MKLLAVHLLRMMKLVYKIARFTISTSKVKLALQCTYLGALRKAVTRKCYQRDSGIEIDDPQQKIQQESTVMEEETVECQDREKSAEQSTAEEENYKPQEKRNRRSYDNEFKLKVIEETKTSQKNEVALKYNIPKSMVTTWVQNE